MSDNKEQTANFTEVIEGIRGGRLVAELDAAIREVVAGVKMHGKKGVVQLKIEVKKAGVGAEYTMLVIDTLTATPPKPDAQGSILFATNTNKLTY